MASSSWKKFICLFAQEHPDFRVQELQALVSAAGSEVRYDYAAYSNENPYLIIELESEVVAREVLKRSLLLRSMFDLWGHGRDYSELKSSILANVPMEPYTRDDYTFKLVGSGFSRKCSSERQNIMFENLSFLPLNGKVDLNNPQHEFHILEDYGGSDRTASLEPVRIFFGRLLGHGQRDLILRYSVKTRHFIGNTSMDAQLSFIMANQAKILAAVGVLEVNGVAEVTPGDLVLDPFAGTGGILLSCAHFGAHVMGADIHWKTVHGKGNTSRANATSKQRGQDENIHANFRQYGLEGRFVDILVADAANSAWRQQELFDAIVTDPPYGIREGGRKIGSKSKQPKAIPPEYLEAHVPEIQAYKLSELFADLVKFAAKCLVVGGRLVYWIPMVKTELPSLPRHPCMRVVSSSLQPLQRHVGRLLVTMEKCMAWKEYELTLRQERTDKLMKEDQEKLKSYDNFREKYFDEDT